MAKNHIELKEAEMREIAREIAREEFRVMHADIRLAMSEVIEEKLGKNYAQEREFLHSWMKKTDQLSSGFFGKLGQVIIMFVFAGIGALALIKFGIVQK